MFGINAEKRFSKFSGEAKKRGSLNANMENLIDS